MLHPDDGDADVTWDNWSFILVRCCATPSTAWNEEWTAWNVDSNIIDTDPKALTIDSID